ncbi:MAG TPA: GPW/gp25 family protein [Candidatus Anaerotruncus excrementipullorum]|uniref:GPW/gp25 family protein n=1 Tax=Candidatus Anaerotruncus excrementipullorum TaxID=2838465 RepID=A0A9D1WSP2_9FIRM|nr:GPW/gp25 family protein [Candidatus Anaerotruncus excrementipullorum]
MGSKEFLGSGLKFPLQVDPRTGKVALSHYEEDIAEAIGIIIHTSQGERVMRPDFGSNVADYIFSPAVHSGMASIAYDVREQLLLQEPRIVDVQVECREEKGNVGGLVINVSYTVRSTNNRYNRVYPFYLTEGAEE